MEHDQSESIEDVEDWLEDQIMAKFPDDLNISIGQLRVRIHILCTTYRLKLLGEDTLPDNEAQLKFEEFWNDPCWQEPV